MTSPKCIPRKFSVLYSKNNKLDWPDNNPGAVRKVTIVFTTISKSVLQNTASSGRRCNSQHEIRLVPAQFMLNINCGLGLGDEADQTQ